MSNETVDPKVKIQVLKSQAVRQAMCEVIAEHRVEIVERARAKLVAMGVEVSTEDLSSIPGAPGSTPA